MFAASYQFFLGLVFSFPTGFPPPLDIVKRNLCVQLLLTNDTFSIHCAFVGPRLWLTVVAITFIIVLCNFCRGPRGLTHQKGYQVVPPAATQVVTHLSFFPWWFSPLPSERSMLTGCCFLLFRPVCHFQAHWLTVDFVAAAFHPPRCTPRTEPNRFTIRPVVHFIPIATHIFACLLLDFASRLFSFALFTFSCSNWLLCFGNFPALSSSFGCLCC